jgi:hypothetical protein
MNWRDWFHGIVKGKVGIGDTLVRGFVLDRKLILSNKDDEAYLFEVLKKRGEPAKKLDAAREALSFISQNLGEEWMTVLPPRMISIKTGQKSSDGLDLFSQLIPLGDALVSLSELEGFENVITKLKTPSYQRLSTILEVMSAVRYKKHGYLVELEPPAGGGSCDFRVLKEGEWIYFECKKENVHESDYAIRIHRYINKLIDDIVSRVGEELGSSYRVDIVIVRKPSRTIQTNEVIDKITQIVRNKELGVWTELNGIRFAIKERGMYVERINGNETFGKVQVGLVPILVILENARVSVSYDLFGKKALQKARGIIKEARDQIPAESRGIIIFEPGDSHRLVKMVEEKLKSESYQHIIGVILMGGGAWFVSNPLHKNFPVDFINIAILG